MNEDFERDLTAVFEKHKAQTTQPTRRRAAKPANQQAEKKLEYSKLILVVAAFVTIAVTVFTCYMVWKTEDLTPLSVLVSVVFVECGVGTAFYYNKAKDENKIKLMAALKIKPQRSDLEG